jgi:hypothetical protein
MITAVRWQETSSYRNRAGLDYAYASQCVVRVRGNCGADRGILRHRGGCGPVVAAGISASATRPRGTFEESVGQDVDVCLWTCVRRCRRIRRGLYCPTPSDYARRCDGDSSSHPNDCGNAVAGGKPRFKIAVDHDSDPKRTGSTGGRCCLSMAHGSIASTMEANATIE